MVRGTCPPRVPVHRVRAQILREPCVLGLIQVRFILPARDIPLFCRHQQHPVLLSLSSRQLYSLESNSCLESTIGNRPAIRRAREQAPTRLPSRGVLGGSEGDRASWLR